MTDPRSQEALFVVEVPGTKLASGVLLSLPIVWSSCVAMDQSLSHSGPHFVHLEKKIYSSMSVGSSSAQILCPLTTDVKTVHPAKEVL